jgi:hypothetical protein
MIWLLPGPRWIGPLGLDIHTLFYASLAVVVGFQAMLFWLFARIFGEHEGIVPADPRLQTITRLFTLEAGLLCAAALLLGGLALGGCAVGFWDVKDFGRLSPTEMMRFVIPSGTLILLGCQIAWGAFFISVLELRGRRPADRPLPRDIDSEAA